MLCRNDQKEAFWQDFVEVSNFWVESAKINVGEVIRNGKGGGRLSRTQRMKTEGQALSGAMSGKAK
jgi:hypothetical protein